jgi:hypothetical protein
MIHIILTLYEVLEFTLHSIISDLLKSSSNGHNRMIYVPCFNL